MRCLSKLIMRKLHNKKSIERKREGWNGDAQEGKSNTEGENRERERELRVTQEKREEMGMVTLENIYSESD